MVERSGVACAASGKSGGFLALDWCDDSPLGPLARASFALHAELAKDIAIDYGYRRMDTFMMAARERGRGAAGIGHAAALARRPGVVTAALGSTETTAQVHPARFTAALIEAARRGQRAHRRGRGDRAAGRQRGDRRACRRRPLEADAVVLALGPWTSAVAGARCRACTGSRATA